MTMTKNTFLTVVAILLSPIAANADLITSTVGDEDCFGIGGSCADGDLFRALGGSFFADNRDAGDIANAPHTDIWGAPGTANWTHDYVLTGGPAISAVLDLVIAGFADIGAVDLFADESLVATFNFPQQFETVHFLSIVMPLGLIDGSTMFTLGPAGGDGYAIDYSTLRIETAVSVPEPGTLALFGIGLLGMGAARRRRRT